jgi:hypothetical protein
MNATSKTMAVLAHADTEGWGGVGNDYLVDVCGESAQSQYGEDGEDVLVGEAGNGAFYLS